MRVLHIDVSAIRDKFYLTLFSLLKKRDIDQIVYTPYNANEYSKEELEWAFSEYGNSNIILHASNIKKIEDRVFYTKKITKYYRNLENEIDLNSIDICHAHSLYSDGGVAYSCYENYGIPYIVAVRSTDIEFMNAFPFLHEYARKVLKNASKIIYLSRDLKDETIHKLFSGKVNKYIDNEEKSLIIPNGVNSFWLENRYNFRRKLDLAGINIIQVSRLEKRKQVDKTIKAVKILLNKGIKCHLSIVGDGSEREKLKSLIAKEKLEQYVDLAGYISSKADLLSLYRQADIFCMPSKGETFGIVYVEAMSQGLPVIGLAGTGVSSYFQKNEIGCFVDKSSPEAVAQGIVNIIENYDSMTNSCISNIDSFDWTGIISNYVDMYKIVISEGSKKFEK